MGLKKLLENPNGGQLLSGYVVLIVSVSLALFVGGNLVLKLFQGETIDYNSDGLGLIMGLAIVIPTAFKFVRSRHAG
jgi:hypothetical protein